MALTKIRNANKKWKHEQRRKQKRQAEKLRMGRAKGILKARRAQLDRRNNEVEYVNQLKGEI